MTHLIYPAKSPVASIGVFNDVDVTSSPPQSGYALLWDDVNEKWYPQSISVSIQTTDDLPEGDNQFYYSDTRVQNYLVNVEIETFSNINSNLDKTTGNILIWENNELISSPLTIPNLGVSEDVNLSILNDGNVLVWDLNQGLWIPTDLNIPETTTDIEEGTQKYFTTARVVSVIQSSEIDSLSNVNESNKELNDFLSWNGSFWTPTSLTDNSPETGDLMMWDGEKWVASKPKDLSYIEVNGDNAIAPNTICGVDSSEGEVVITLSETPQNGDEVVIFDLAGSDPINPTGFGLNQVSIVPALNHTIQGYESLELKTDNLSVGLVYSSSKNRWSIYQKT